MNEYESLNKNQENIKSDNDFIITECQVNMTATSGYSQIGSSEVVVPEKLIEFIYTVIVQPLAKVSNLQEGFCESLKKIVQQEGVVNEKMKNIHLYLNYFLNNKKNKIDSDTRWFLNGSLELIDLAGRLQYPQSSTELYNNFKYFTSQLNILLISDFFKQNLLNDLSADNKIILKQAQSVIAIISEATADEPDIQHIIKRISNTELLPANFQATMQSFEILVKLYQMHSLPNVNNKGWKEWLIAVLNDNDTLFLLNDYVPKELRPILLICVEMMQQVPSSFSKWLIWFKEHGSAFLQEEQWQQVNDWLSIFSSKITSLLEMAELMHNLFESHPLPKKDEVPGWLLNVLLDRNAHHLLKPFLSVELSAMLNVSSPFLSLLQQYPTKSSLQQQFSWAQNEYQHPSPELRQLLSQLPMDSFLAELKRELSQNVINPQILDALLILVNPGASLQDKSTQLFYQLTGFISLGQAIKFGFRQLAPSGDLMVDLWDWYWRLPSNLDWNGVFIEFSKLLEKQYTGAERLANSLIKGTWKEVGERAFDLAASHDPRVKYIYLRYMELCILWAAKEYRSASEPAKQELAQQNLCWAVENYFQRQGIPLPTTFSNIISGLKVLWLVQDEIRVLPTEGGWLPWMRALLEMLEKHTQANSLRNSLEKAVQETISDIIGQRMSEVALEIIHLSGKQLKVAGMQENILSLFVSTIASGEQLSSVDKNDTASRVTTKNTSWLTKIIKSGRLRNVALGIAGWYMLSNLGGAEAAPINKVDGQPEIEIEIDGVIYVLVPSEYDSDEQGQQLWERISTLSLSMAALSVFGLLAYRYFTHKKTIKQNHESADSAGVELLGETGDVIASSNSQQRTKDSVLKEYMTEIIAFLTLISGGGGYIYSRKKIEYYEKHQSNLLNNKYNFNPVIEITPELLSEYTVKGSIPENIASVEEVALLSKNKEKLNPHSRDKRSASNYVQDQENDISNSLKELLIIKKWGSEDDVNNSGKVIEPSYNDGVYSINGFKFLKINGIYWDLVGEGTYDNPYNIKNVGSAESIRVFKDFNKWEIHYEYKNSSMLLEDTPVTEALSELLVKEKWRSDDWSGFGFYDISKNERVNGMYCINNNYYMKVEGFYWVFVADNNDFMSGEVIISTNKKRIKVVVNKENRWTTHDYKQVVREGSRLIKSIISWNVYTYEVRQIVTAEISYILKDKDYLEFNSLKLLLIDALFLTFVRNVQDPITAFRLLQVINELQVGINGKKEVSAELLKLLKKEDSIPDFYFTLIGCDVDNLPAYEDALIEHWKGQSLKNKVGKLIDASDALLKNTYKAIKIKFNAQQIEGIGQLYRDSEYAGVLIENNNLLEESLKFRIKNIEELKVDFNKEVERVREVSSTYLSGIDMAESLRGNRYLDFKTYNNVLFSIFCQAAVALRVGFPIKEVVEKCSAAKYYLNYIYQSVLILEVFLDFVPDNIKGLSLEYGTVYGDDKKERLEIVRYNDYRDILLAEEVAWQFYDKNKSDLDAVINGNTWDWGDFDCELILSAIIFYKIRNDLSNDKLKMFSVRYMMDFYLTAKKSENKFNFIGNGVPDGYYTLRNFTNRNSFNSQYEYNEQFNNYISKYMEYDVENILFRNIKEQNINYESLLSPVTSAHFFPLIGDSSNSTTGYNKSHMGGVISLRLKSEKWLVILAIDGNIDFNYISKHGYNGPLAVFIEPENKFGDELFFVASRWKSSFIKLKNTYPPDSIAKEELSSYKKIWDKPEYNFEGYPLFNIGTKYNLAANPQKIAFDYIKEFINDNYKEIIEKMRSSLDNDGTWHTIAKSLIPFYNVIYSTITNSQYKLKADDIVSIVFDVSSIVVSLVSLGINAINITDDIVIKLTTKYLSQLKNGVSKNVMYTRLLSELPEVLIRDLTTPISRLIRKELISFLNPTPFDVERITSSIYGFASRNIKSMARNIRGDIINIPTRFNKDWRVKDDSVINKIKEGEKVENSLYTCKNNTDDSLGYFLLNNGNFYPVIPSNVSGELHLINSIDKEKATLYHTIYAGKDSDFTNLIDKLDGNNKGFITQVPITERANEIFRDLSLAYPVERVMSGNKHRKLDNNFVVVPSEIIFSSGKSIFIPKGIINEAINQMRSKSSELQLLVNDNSLYQSYETLRLIKENEKFSNDIINSENTIHIQFSLVESTAILITDPDAIYGVVNMIFNKSTSMLSLDGIYIHPCCIAAQDKNLLNFMDALDIEKYKLKNVDIHLGLSAMKQFLDIIKDVYYPSKIKSIFTMSENKIVERIFSEINEFSAAEFNPFRKMEEKTHMLMEDITELMGYSNVMDRDTEWLLSSDESGVNNSLVEKLLFHNEKQQPNNEMRILTKEKLERKLVSVVRHTFNKAWQANVNLDDLSLAENNDKHKGVYIRKQDEAGGLTQSNKYIVQDNIVYEVVWRENNWYLKSNHNIDENLAYQYPIKLNSDGVWDYENDDFNSSIETSDMKRIKRVFSSFKRKFQSSPRSDESSPRSDGFYDLNKIMPFRPPRGVVTEGVAIKKNRDKELSIYKDLPYVSYVGLADAPITLSYTFIPEVVPVIREAFKTSDHILNLACNKLLAAQSNAREYKVLVDYFRNALHIESEKDLIDVINRITEIANNALVLSNNARNNNYSNFTIVSGAKSHDGIIKPNSDVVAWVIAGDPNEKITLHAELIASVMQQKVDGLDHVSFTLLHEYSHLAVHTLDLLYLGESVTNMYSAQEIYDNFYSRVEIEELDKKSALMYISAMRHLKGGSMDITSDDITTFNDAVLSKPLLLASIMLSNADNVAAYLFDIAHGYRYDTNNYRLNSSLRSTPEAYNKRSPRKANHNEKNAHLNMGLLSIVIGMVI